jgi:hypothetical protein
MKSKKLICGAVAATMALSISLSGCTLVSTKNEEDMSQVIATVDISKSENLASEGLDAYASAITSTEIIKRDLVSAFINVGYSYVQNGSSYSDVFTVLVDSLTSTAVLTQYATLYMLKEKSKTESDALAQFTKEGLTEAQRYEYLLGGENSDDVKLSKYTIYSSINSSLDSLEEDIISSSSSTSGTDSRSTPTNVDTLKDDYYPTDKDGNINYGIYTGYDGYLLNSNWDYEKVEGTTRNTRRRAYNSFITTLKSNYLITEDDKDTTDVWNLNYIQEEYVSQLQQMVINNFYDVFEAQQEELIKQTDSSGVYTFLKGRYENLLAQQENSYSSISDFESAMDSMSDTSFILYSPDTTSNTEGGNGTFGYVYNILLPFDSIQSARLSELTDYLDNDVIDQDAYYKGRKEILSEITTTDQRSAWFNGTTDYSFDATDSGLNYYGKDAGRNYLFFKNNLVSTDKYEELENYIGLYTYNGTVTKNDDDTYSLTPNVLTIDGMLKEFEGYVNSVLGDSGKVVFDEGVTDSYNAVTTYYKEGSKKDIDYSKFIYASGKIDFGDADKNNMFVTSKAQYLAMAAVNELQYAYTTDTSALSNYIGYSVSAYSTSYIKEFEYAAQTAVKEGAGTFSVCAGDYGWHLIYVTDTFKAEGNEVYTPVWTAERIETEGTFEYKFYEWVKDSILSDVTTTKRKTISELFGGDTTVTKYEKTYQDLLELDS